MYRFPVEADVDAAPDAPEAVGDDNCAEEDALPLEGAAETDDGVTPLDAATAVAGMVTSVLPPLLPEEDEAPLLLCEEEEKPASAIGGGGGGPGLRKPVRVMYLQNGEKSSAKNSDISKSVNANSHKS